MADIITMPKLGFDMAEGTLVRWVVNEGEAINKGAVLAEIETDKATVEVESTRNGVVLRHLISQGTIVPINAPIAVIGEAGEEVDIDSLLGGSIHEVISPSEVKPTGSVAERVTPPQPIAVSEIQELPGLPGGVRASPLARHLAEEKGIDLRTVKGTGPGGRVTKADVEAYLTLVTEQMQPRPAGITTIPTTIPPQVSIGETLRKPLPRLRATIGRRMVESTQQIPHFFVTHDYDVSSLIDMRKEINAFLPEEEKISVNDFIIKAVALALREFPNLNTSIDLKNETLLVHKEINIGVAVAVDNGLLTVVNRNTDQKTLHQISIEVKSMVNRARDGKVRSEDIDGSTFTVSNLGMFNVDQFSAIINPPEAAILAIGSVRQVPVVRNNEINVGMQMKTTLSIDHRISDGAEGARFLQTLGKYLEEPLRLLI